jgi:hypothetical protein
MTELSLCTLHPREEGVGDIIAIEAVPRILLPHVGELLNISVDGPSPIRISRMDDLGGRLETRVGARSPLLLVALRWRIRGP